MTHHNNNEDFTAKLDAIGRLIGKTPVLPLFGASKGIYAKLEYTNFSGSIKDRAAMSILKNSIETGRLNSNTVIIESTSGNFGISLALFSIALGIEFIAVIDANTPHVYKKTLQLLAGKTIEVKERDESGGYLLNRIKTVNEFVEANSNAFNPNQYKNRYNYMAYLDMADEIASQFRALDYVVVSVSSGGTITGLSKRLKEHFPSIKVVAVDVEGSLVFSKKVAKRRLSGIGSSMRSDFIDTEKDIDEVMILGEDEIAEGCTRMATRDFLFAGASSGAAYCGAKRILERHGDQDVKILFICPDRGYSYIDSVYDAEWQKKAQADKVNLANEQ